MSEPFVFRHDLHVVAVAALLLFLGGMVHHEAGPRMRTVTSGPVSVKVPADWILERSWGAEVLRGEDAVTRLELRSAEKPSPLVPLESSLELERVQRHGNVYQRLESATRGPWLRTVFAYAFKPTPTHAPRVVTAVEYARLVGDRLWVVTLHAPEERIDELERLILGTLEVR